MAHAIYQSRNRRQKAIKPGIEINFKFIEAVE